MAYVYPCCAVQCKSLYTLLTHTCAQGRATYMALLKNWFWCVPTIVLSHALRHSMNKHDCDMDALLWC